MGAALGAYIDAMEHDGRLDADEAWLERLIAAKASLLKDGLLSEFTGKFNTICAAHSD